MSRRVLHLSIFIFLFGLRRHCLFLYLTLWVFVFFKDLFELEAYFFVSLTID